jgi:hypothetical protein
MLRLAAAFLAALLVAAPLSAQWGSGWCPTCYVTGAVDIPNASTGWTGYFAGWGFECGSGAGVDQVDIYLSSPSQFFRITNYDIYFGQHRPDVADYFLPLCPSVQSHTGWAVYPRAPLPSGTWTVQTVLKRGSIYTNPPPFTLVIP